MLASKKGRALAARMPRERVLTESDGPFAQLDGHPVKPWHVENAIQALSEIWLMSPREVDQKIHENLRGLLAAQNPVVASSFSQL
jgi:TatD DNase family protein